MKKTILLLFVLLLSSALFAQQKFALVIGNSSYNGISRLNNPVNDANDMEAALRELGFNVTKVLNGNLNQMLTAVTNLKRSLLAASPNAYGFFFYAGHGVQSNGENYLIPVDAGNIQSENLLRQFAVSLQFVMDELGDAGNQLNMIVLDACRDNPFGWSRSGTRGLSVVSNAPSGSIVMYATSANSTAADGTGRNGLFSSHLLNNMKTPGLSVYEIFDKTMGDVSNATSGRQQPELSLRFSGAASVYLGSRPSPSPTPPQPVPPSPSPAPANMVRIEGGTFMMGSPTNEEGRNDNEVMHRVTVSSFYMGKYPVTQKEWREVMGSTVRQQMNMAGASTLYGEGDNYPMCYVSWYEAIEYCNRLSQREGLAPAYAINGTNVTRNPNANGYRLPTEAEWEYACRAGTTTAYNTGNNISDNTVWYYNNSRGSTHPVGQKPANAWGLYDMHGNVWEWCWDWYGGYSSGSQTDPMGASSGSVRVLRGGSYANSEENLRSALRHSETPSSRYYVIGFRIVRNAQ